MNIPLPEDARQPDPTPAPAPRISAAAVASLVLGLLIVPLNIFAGLPALLLGYRSLYLINASEGRLRGRGLAITGMVLGCLGCLLGVFFAVMQLGIVVQGTDARADCANNLRQIGLGLQQYQMNHFDTYPQGTIPNPNLKPEERLSWLVTTLPYLSRRKTVSPARWESLLDSIDREQSWEAPVHQTARTSNVPTFLCPGYPDNSKRNTPGLADYIGLAGIGTDAATLPRDDPRAGFFGYDRTVTGKQMERQLATTLIVTETTWNNGPWIAGGPATVRGIDPEDGPLIGIDRPLGGCHFSYRGGEPGLNTLWLDGSVQYKTASMPAELLAEHTRINPPREK
jgi:hypothetical protein